MREPPPGMNEDGELVVLEPGQPIPQPKILMPDGTVLTPDGAKAKFAAEDAAMDAKSQSELDELFAEVSAGEQELSEYAEGEEDE